MIPFLTYPLALAALAALPALAAIYLLRNRFRRRQVSSLVLWSFPVPLKEGGARLNRLQLPLIFFLELLALLLLVAAATGPHLRLAQSVRPLTVVLDDSFSMLAGTGQETPRERAFRSLENLFRLQPPPATRLVLAGLEPRLLGAPARTWPEVAALLEEWRCQAPAAALEQALQLAAESGTSQANLLVLTDQPPPQERIDNDRLQWRSFGNPLPNLAIVNASRVPYGEEDRCLLEVANYAASPLDSRLVVRAGSNLMQQTDLKLGPRELQRVVFNLPRAHALLRAELEPDSLAADNVVHLLSPPRPRVRVRSGLVSAEHTSLLERTLDATGLRAAVNEDPELVFHPGAASVGTNAWSVRWLTGTNSQVFTGPYVIDNAHPLAQGLTLAGVVWAAVPDLTNTPGEVPVILAGNVPLLSAREDFAGRRFITLNLDPELSSLQRSPDWPALLWNLLDWRAAERPGLVQVNTRQGTEFFLRGSGDPVVVRQPDGATRRLPGARGDIAIETPQAGLYTVAWGQTTNQVAVNPLAPEESDLLGCSSGHWGAWVLSGGDRYEQSPVGWFFALGAAGLLVLHLGILAGGKQGQ